MLSKKCQYALHALLYLAEHEEEKSVTIGEIATARKIPKKFLEVILLDLKNSGILGSKLGKGGGYYLRKNPSAITMTEVIRLFDGAVSMIPCVSLNFYESCGMCSNEDTCQINRLFSQVRDETLKILSVKSLSDLMQNPVQF
jgi:Rrf2 family protein